MGYLEGEFGLVWLFGSSEASGRQAGRHVMSVRYGGVQDSYLHTFTCMLAGGIVRQYSTIMFQTLISLLHYICEAY